MSYRNFLLERRRQIEAQTIEPSVLDYIDLRNQQSMVDWRRRCVEHELARLSGRRERGKSGRTQA